MKINLFLKNIKEKKDFNECQLDNIDFENYDFSSSYFE